jgi:Helix-hairpin-helix motif
MRTTFTHSYVSVLFLLLNALSLFAQTDSLSSLPDDIQQNLIETFVEGAEEESDFDFNTAFENRFNKKLNINKASREDLVSLGLFTDIQINQLLSHREKFGDLIAIHELQSIPGFDLQVIRQILPFITVKGNLDDYNLSLFRMIQQGKNELFIRWQRTVEEQRGYIAPEDGGPENGYLGDPNKYFVRFRHSFDNRLSMGFTMEKDAGEEFFRGSNKQGFDFYSAHFYLNNYSKRLKTIAIGDYKLSMGQGLVRFSGFGTRKSAFVTNIKRGGKAIDKYTSVNEVNFMRGVATTIGLGEHFELTTFYSRLKRDANIVQPTSDTLELDEGILVSSLQSSGLHRTASEIEDKNALINSTLGGILKYKTRDGQLAMNVLYDYFDKELKRTPLPYSQYYFNGSKLLNASLDYNYRYQNLYFFGETAWSDNNRFATSNGVLLTLDRWVDLAVLHRHFQKDYMALLAQPFAETTGGRNETGLYIGVEMRPANQWKIQTYFDSYKHPWLRFNADAPSSGYDFFSRITYWQKRKMEVYLQVRMETKEINNTAATDKIDPLQNERILQARLHFAQTVTKQLTLRSRVFWGYSKRGDADYEFGFGAYQDVNYEFENIPFSFSLRYALYNTDSYNVRFYHYENDVLYSFSVPAYYNKGSRVYLNLQFDGIPNTTIELRYARTIWTNATEFGSGLDEIDGNGRTDVKVQVRYKF